jgi:hypothetical protein
VQAINGLLRGITFSSEMGTGSLEENAFKKAMAAAGSSAAERKQKGRREAGLFSRNSVGAKISTSRPKDHPSGN